ncbi:MAG: lysophospholipase [Lachnospiraceae bacterium]|nr:lysophospholipase [Lachnospiraceae bacterium]
MNKVEFTYDSRDGKSVIHAVKWIPDGEPRAIFQIIHGMAEYIDRYSDFAEYLCEKGYLVTGDDHLGHGKTAAANNAKKGYICERHGDTVMVRDVHRLKKIIQGEYPGVPYFILGHSMGSFMVRNYMYRYGTGIDGAIVMGTGHQSRGLLRVSRSIAAIQGFILGDDHVSGLINALAFGSYNKRIPKAKSHFDWITRDEKILDKYIADPDCGFTFTVNGFKCLFKLLWKLTDDENIEQMPVDLPVLIVSGAEDPVGAYGVQVRQVYDSYIALGMKDVKMQLYPDDRHELLNELDREQVYKDVYEWVEKHLA